MDRDTLFPTRLSVEAATQEAKQALAAQMAEGEIVATPGRTRPLYFDGRFLTAADLTADQDYVRNRLADMGRAIGAGVVNGLQVQAATVNNRPGLQIAAGHGFTPSGELVSLPPPGPHFVAFNDIDVQQRVALQLGLRSSPQASSRSQLLRTGLYVLALRPVEFSADPVASYPTTLDGSRGTRDGNTVEAVAITLLPYTERASANATPHQRRAQVAREAFFERNPEGMLQDALPLAVLQLDAGRLVWLDSSLARREVGTESGLAVTLNPRPRAVLEAWFAQYRDQLAELSASGPFVASQVFSALPPAGPMPAAAVEWEQGFDAGLRQSYFPPTADVEFSFVAEDELPLLIDQGLGLPPIDLQADAAALDHLALLILAPVPRTTLQDIRRNLDSARRPIRLATPSRTALRSPLASLMQLGGLRAPLRTSLPGGLLLQPILPSLPTLVPPIDTLNAAWQRAFESAVQLAQQRHGGMFFYVRRRQLPYSSEIQSHTLRLAGTPGQLDAELLNRLRSDGMEGDYDAATASSPLLTRAVLLNVLAGPRLALGVVLRLGTLAVSDLLRRAALREVILGAKQAGSTGDGAGAGLPHDNALRLSERYGGDRLGEGWQRLFIAQPSLGQTARADVVINAGVVPELDTLAADLPEEAMAALAARLADLAEAGDTAGIAALVQ